MTFIKKIHILLSALSLAAAAPATLSAQNNFQLVEESVSNPDNTPAPVYPVPSDRQLNGTKRNSTLSSTTA